MNKKGFAISIILYSMVFLLISIFYMLLGIVRTRYSVTSKLRESIVDKLNNGDNLGDTILELCDNSNIAYVQKYNPTQNGVAIDTPDGSGDKDVCYYTTSSTNRNSDAEQNANVIFGDFCWQIVRTTADGGVKLLYNGPKTLDNKCTSDADTINYSSNPRPSSIGVVGSSGSRSTISGNKIYGDSFEIYDDNGTNMFKLKNTSSASWSDATYQNLIGKYVCGTSSSPTGDATTCTVLYYIGQYQSNTEASTTKYTIGSNVHYSQIGTSSFNASSDSPALVGYMYGDVYNNKSRSFLTTIGDVIPRTIVSSSYYYGDTATWVNDHYELTIGGVTPTTTSSWSSIRSSAEGMYTCLSSSSTSCASVHYIVANSSNSYMYSILLSNGETKDKMVTWHYGTSVTKVGNTYTLMDGNNTSSLTKTFKLADWYTTYNTDTGYRDIYVCDDFTSTSCEIVRYISRTEKNYEAHYALNYTYKFANDITYDATTHEYKYDLSKAVQDIYDWRTQYNTIDNTHYTCLDNYDEVNNTCGANNPIYYVYFTSGQQLNYIELNNNEKVEDALQKMLNIDNSSENLINKYNSAIKGVIDSWYESNLATLESYINQTSVYCNDRSIKSYGGWATNGSTTTNYSLNFKYSSITTKKNATLGCANVTDRFSKTNEKAELIYPIGLLTESERAMMFVGYTRTEWRWWLLSPYDFSLFATNRETGSSGDYSDSFSYSSRGLRPVIVLKPGVEIEGNGTYDDPYIVNTTEKAKFLTVKAIDQSIVYGSEIAKNLSQVTIEGLLDNHTVTSVDLSASTSELTTSGTITPSNVVIKDENDNDITAQYSIVYETGNLIIGKNPCNKPINVQIHTDGKVTWTPSSNCASAQHQISMDGTTWTNASSGVDKKSDITSSAGSKTVYVKALAPNNNYTDSESERMSINVYTLSLSTGTGIKTVTGAGKYIAGSVATITATLNSGYNFTNWSVTSGNTPTNASSASTTVTINQNTSLKANGKSKEVTYSIQCRCVYSQESQQGFNDYTSSSNPCATQKDADAACLKICNWFPGYRPVSSSTYCGYNGERNLSKYCKVK